MRRMSRDHAIFLGLIAFVIYQNSLLYLSVNGGTQLEPYIVIGTFVVGICLGRTTYLILAGIIAFISVSVGSLLLVLPKTREVYLVAAIALVTVTPMTMLLVYLLDHRSLKRQALDHRLRQFKHRHPEVDLVTGAANRHALEIAIQRELQAVLHHQHDYRFTLTLVKIDFLESVVNFLGHERFNELLRVTSQQIAAHLSTVDRLYYLGTGRFVVKSPKLSTDNVELVRQNTHILIDKIAATFGLAANGLVLRVGQISSAPTSDQQVAEILARLERSAETDIVKEYL